MQSVYGKRNKSSFHLEGKLTGSLIGNSFTTLFNSNEDQQLLAAIRDTAAAKPSIAPQSHQQQSVKNIKEKREKATKRKRDKTVEESTEARSVLKDITNLPRQPTAAVSPEVVGNNLQSFLTSTPSIQLKPNERFKERSKIASPICIRQDDLSAEFLATSPPPFSFTDSSASVAGVEEIVLMDNSDVKTETFVSEFQQYIQCSEENKEIADNHKQNIPHNLNNDACVPNIQENLNHFDCDHIEKELNDTIQSITISISKDPFTITFPTNIKVATSDIYGKVCVKQLPFSLPKTNIVDEILMF